MPNYMSQKTFDNDLVVLRESKVTLRLNKPANHLSKCVFVFGR